MSTTYVYDKATDAGGDRFIVVPPNNLFQLPFSNEDWNSIKVGIIHSVTNSASGGAEEMWLPQPSGDTWPDEFAGPGNYSFIGIGISAASPSKPTAPSNGFIGLAFDGIMSPGFAINEPINNKYGVQYADLFVGNVDDKWRFVVDNGISSTAVEKRPTFNWGGIPIAIPNLSASSNFASYLGLKYTVINKNQSNQQMEIEVRLYSTNGGHENEQTWQVGMQTDTSINNLKERVILDAYPREVRSEDLNIHRATFDWHANGTPLPLPNAFIWYNSFFSVRPRLHSIAIKRES